MSTLLASKVCPDSFQKPNSTARQVDRTKLPYVQINLKQDPETAFILPHLLFPSTQTLSRGKYQDVFAESAVGGLLFVYHYL